MFDLYDESYSTDEIYAVEAADIAADKQLLMLNTFMETHELSGKLQDLRMMVESADAEEMINFYEDANAEAEGKIQTMLKRAWEAVKEFIRKIKETIKNIFRRDRGKAVPNEVVEVPEEVATNVKKLPMVWAKVKGLILRSGKAIHDHPGVVAVIALLGGIAAFTITGATSDIHTDLQDAIGLGVTGVSLAVAGVEGYRYAKQQPSQQLRRAQLMAVDIEKARSSIQDMLNCLDLLSEKAAKNPESVSSLDVGTVKDVSRMAYDADCTLRKLLYGYADEEE